MNKKETISFKNETILAFAILISFTVISLLLQVIHIFGWFLMILLAL